MKRLLLPCVPALGGFGPLFIVMGLNFSNRTSPLSFNGAFSICGAFMTSIALLIMLQEVVNLRQILQAKTEKNDP